MDEAQMQAFIINELRHYRKVEDIIFDICNRTSKQWNEVAPFVRQVARDSKDEIQESRKPFMIAPGAFVFFAGVGLMILIALATLDGWIIFPIALPVPYLGNAIFFVTGLGMAIGGANGVMQLVMNLGGKPE